MADAHLRAEDRSLAVFLGVEGRWVELGAVVGQPTSMAAVAPKSARWPTRVTGGSRLKIGPGWDLGPGTSWPGPFPHLALQVDANGAYPAGGYRHLAQLDRFGLLCVEQPLTRPTGRPRPLAPAGCHADLPRRERRFAGTAPRALALGACSVVCVKPARLGGLGRPSRWWSLYRSGGSRCGWGDVRVRLRPGVNTTVAARPGFCWPGDLSPARTYLAADLVPPPDLSRTRTRRRLMARGPRRGPGMGPPPDAERLRPGRG